MSNSLKIDQQAKSRLPVEHPASIWTRNFILLCLANLAMFMSLQMLIPTLPLYLFKIGGDQADVGYVMAAYTIGAMLTRPIAGWLLDNYSRKRIILLGMAMIVAVSIFYRLASNVSLIIVVRGLHGLAFGLVSTAIGTIVADSLPTSRLGEGIGYFGLTSSFSLALAPMIGIWLTGKSDYSILFISVSILALLSFCLCLPVRNTNAPVSAQGNSITEIWSSLLEKTALLPSGVIFFLAMIHGSVISFIALYGAERGIANIGLFFTATALTMLISRPISGRWADKGGTDMLLLISFLSLFFGMIAIGLSHNIVGFLFAGAALGLGFGICLPTLQALAVRHAPAHRRGSATGTFFVAFDLGIGLGTILWGFVAEATSYQTMYFATLIPLALAGVFYYRLRDSHQPV